MSNPYRVVTANYENLKLDDTWQKPICLVLRIMERNYTTGFTGGNAHQFVLAQLKAIWPEHTMVQSAEQEWQPFLYR